MTCVVCTANVKKPLSRLRTGLNAYQVKIVSMRKKNAGMVFAKLEKRKKEALNVTAHFPPEA